MGVSATSVREDSSNFSLRTDVNPQKRSGPAVGRCGPVSRRKQEAGERNAARGTRSDGTARISRCGGLDGKHQAAKETRDAASRLCSFRR